MPYEAFRHAILLYFRHRFTFWVLWIHENWLGRVKTSPFLAFLGSKTRPDCFEMTQNNLREVPEGSRPSLDQKFLTFPDIDSLFEAFYWNNWNYFVRDSRNLSKENQQSDARQPRECLGNWEITPETYWKCFRTVLV